MQAELPSLLVPWRATKMFASCSWSCWGTLLGPGLTAALSAKSGPIATQLPRTIRHSETDLSSPHIHWKSSLVADMTRRKSPGQRAGQRVQEKARDPQSRQRGDGRSPMSQDPGPGCVTCSQADKSSACVLSCLGGGFLLSLCTHFCPFQVFCNEDE